MHAEYSAKKRRTKKVLSIAVSSILLLSIVILFLPHKLVKDPESIRLIRICYLEDKIDERDIDTQRVLDILSSVQRRRIYGQSVRSIGADILEVDFLADDKSIHMVFDEENYCYHTMGILRQYKTLDADNVRAKIMEAIRFD